MVKHKIYQGHTPTIPGCLEDTAVASVTLSIIRSQFQVNENPKLITAAGTSRPHASFTRIPLPSLLLLPSVVDSTNAASYSHYPLNGGLPSGQKSHRPTDLAPGGSTTSRQSGGYRYDYDRER